MCIFDFLLLLRIAFKNRGGVCKEACEGEGEGRRREGEGEGRGKAAKRVGGGGDIVRLGQQKGQAWATKVDNKLYM